MPPTHIIKYLAVVPETFPIIGYNSNPVAFKKFLKKYNNDILAGINNAKSSAMAMSNCNQYLDDMLKGFYAPYLDDKIIVLENSIRTLYSLESSDTKLSSFPKSALHKAALCIKETKTYSDDGEALRNLYKINLEDKEALTEPMYKCFNKTTLSDKKKVAQQACNHFKTMDSNSFVQVNKAYYSCMDTRYQNYKENCIDISKFDSDLNLIGNAYDEL